MVGPESPPIDFYRSFASPKSRRIAACSVSIEGIVSASRSYWKIMNVFPTCCESCCTNSIVWHCRGMFNLKLLRNYAVPQMVPVSMKILGLKQKNAGEKKSVWYIKLKYPYQTGWCLFLPVYTILLPGKTWENQPKLMHRHVSLVAAVQSALNLRSCLPPGQPSVWDANQAMAQTSWL